MDPHINGTQHQALVHPYMGCGDDSDGLSCSAFANPCSSSTLRANQQGRGIVSWFPHKDKGYRISHNKNNKNMSTLTVLFIILYLVHVLYIWSSVYTQRRQYRTLSSLSLSCLGWQTYNSLVYKLQWWVVGFRLTNFALWMSLVLVLGTPLQKKGNTDPLYAMTFMVIIWRRGQCLPL